MVKSNLIGPPVTLLAHAAWSLAALPPLGLLCGVSGVVFCETSVQHGLASMWM